MTIAQVIAGRGEVWSCHADDSVADAVDMLARYRIGALPVEDGTNGVAGIFSERDMIRCLHKHGEAALHMKVRDMMTAPVVTITPQTSVLEALALMTQRRFRHLPVVEGGHMVAFVSIGDLVKHRIDKIEAEADAMRVYIQQA
ncbi:putative signal-transduction protein with CBS domains [Novosphingobium aromaticivorans DSM 12444]|uniref:Putative signal-transduction protein with CBS domains n=1 Tax=Novosphingobium aromaticivorans (strain ATCC 700278 / DSM 12444 / CCUG 56034 / CIP 105152 / NBRC 16084 / F199) TaxID=279238 RepID=Q2GC21_NOVAD|nr:CBS domain-containing protein [Novosphingobium aromaticivorans]ABD24602.1 putative signal-transduction protein with CBS domains [Novosphingobium aromaticivorans DSM 12444]SCY23197.1 CBS domain-containing protein [Novosphingobium aromaticivorans]